MKKILWTLFMGTSALMAGNAQKIVALEYGMATINQTYGTGSTADNASANSYGIKLGAKEDSMRLFISYRLQSIKYTSATKYGNNFGLELDYFLQMGPLGLYLGPVAGYTTYAFIGQDTTTRSVKAPYYGAEGGLTFTLGHFELDAGARYSYLGVSNTEVTAQEYAIDNKISYYLSVNYVY